MFLLPFSQLFGVDFVDLFSSLVFLDYTSPINICCKAGLVILRSLNCWLSVKLFIFSSVLNEIPVEYSDLGCRFFHLFILLMASFAVQKLFKFNQIPPVYFYFHYPKRWVTEDLAVIYVKECSACVFLQEFYSFWSYMKKCSMSLIIQFSSVQSLSRIRLFATP